MKTILVVEDSHAEQQLIKGLLTLKGCSVVLQDTAEQAWDWLEHNPLPHLIILDVVMPGQSGFELCRKIRSDNKLNDVPIVFCTSKDQDFDRFWALRQGGNAYLIKPFAPKEFLDAVEKYII